MDIKAGISKPIGPLPLWGWVVIVISGYIIYKLFLSGGNATDESNSTASATNNENTSGGGSGSSSGDSVIQVDLASSHINAPSTTTGSVVTVAPTAVSSTNTPTNQVNTSGAGTGQPVTSGGIIAKVPIGSSGFGGRGGST